MRTLFSNQGSEEQDQRERLDSHHALVAIRSGANTARIGEGRVEEGIARRRTQFRIERHSRIRSTSLNVISSFVRS
jgi:hypothetical protein